MAVSHHLPDWARKVISHDFIVQSYRVQRLRANAVARINIATEKAAAMPRDAARGRGSPGPPRTRRRASTPYVSGLAIMTVFTHGAALSGGKTAPERSHSGMRNRFMIAWKPWTESKRQARRTPRAVRPNPTSAMIPRAAAHPAGENGTPTRGPNRRKIVPWVIAMAVPPRTLPSTIDARGTGATRTPWRNPVWRSWMMEIVEKMEANSRIWTRVPGKRYPM